MGDCYYISLWLSLGCDRELNAKPLRGYYENYTPYKKRYIMKLSTHYYVLSLSERRSQLYEAFRDNFIDVQNANFPFNSPVDTEALHNPALKDSRLREFLRETDRHFAHYYNQDPLMLVVVGENKYLTLFESETTHREVIIDMVEGDYSETSEHDLGKITWSIVKTALAGAVKNAIYDLMAVDGRKRFFGIDAVAKAAQKESGSILFVEEDYHIKGSLRETDRSVVLSSYVDVTEVFDDAVDVIVEKVLKMDGNVVFLDSGSLVKFQRIALITPEQNLEGQNSFVKRKLRQEREVERDENELGNGVITNEQKDYQQRRKRGLISMQYSDGNEFLSSLCLDTSSLEYENLSKQNYILIERGVL